MKKNKNTKTWFTVYTLRLTGCISMRMGVNQTVNSGGLQFTLLKY